MQVTYVGRSTVGVSIAINDAEVFVEHGATVDVPDDLGASLLSQDGQWTAAKTPKAAKAAPEEE